MIIITEYVYIYIGLLHKRVPADLYLRYRLAGSGFPQTKSEFWVNSNILNVLY